MATAIAFHFHVGALQAYLCRLLRKVTLAGHRSWVLLPEEYLRATDDALWTFSAQEFVTHAVWGHAPESVLRRSAVVLSSAELPEPSLGIGVLVNLLPAVPVGFERFERLLEIVPEDDALKAAARERWRYYVAQGLNIERHDVAQLVGRRQGP